MFTPYLPAPLSDEHGINANATRVRLSGSPVAPFRVFSHHNLGLLLSGIVFGCDGETDRLAARIAHGETMKVFGGWLCPWTVTDKGEDWDPTDFLGVTM